VKKTNVLFADFLLLLVAVIWGGGFAAGKLALTGLSPAAVLLYRFALAAIVIGLIFFPKIKKATKAEVLYGCLLGSLLFFGLMIQLAALQYTTAAKQSFIASAYVIFTPLLAWLLFREKPAFRELAAAVLVLSGVACISLSRGLRIQSGDFMTLGFTLIFALQIIIIGKFTKNLSAVNVTFFQLSAAAVLAAAVAAVLDIPVKIEGSSCMVGVLYLAVINTSAAMLLQNFAQKHTKESHAALLLSMESVFGFIVSVLMFHDPVSGKMLLGCFLILAGVLLSKIRVGEKLSF